MNSVRQVSIVDLDVALTVLVTESPKKLKPLNRLAMRDTVRQEDDSPNANHDGET